MFSHQVLEHFERPRNCGELAGASARVTVENPACGDRMLLAARIDHDKIVEIKFLVRGCPPAIACGSVLTELLQGKKISDAANVSRDDLLRALGELPPESMHAVALAMDAARSLAHALPQG